ncbi:hypothetical protein [Algoriphagus lacus]|nr:hypothetical protein [Algoriphagus lacus]
MKKIWMFFVLFGGLSLAVFAQEATVEEAVTDEDLKKYATVEVMTSEFVQKKTDELRNMILNNEVIKGGARYNEIKAAWGDEAKLTAANVTPEEKAAYQVILDFQGSLQQSVVDYKTELIKDDAILGVSTYNKVNGAIKEDPALKEKMDQMVEEMKAKEGDGDNPVN